jgi:hypothetical protein
MHRTNGYADPMHARQRDMVQLHCDKDSLFRRIRGNNAETEVDAV